MFHAFPLRFFGPLVLSCVMGMALALPASAQSYQLAAADVVHLRVIEWRPAEQVFSEWGAMTGNYQIGQTGTISIPFLGEIESAGRTTGELASTISTELRQTLGLVSAPDVTVEVAEFGPIYLTGDVQTPGEYRFTPGLNVIKAVSLAGGERRASESMRIDRELINAQGSLEVLESEFQRLLVRRVRVEAELAEQETVDTPPELADDPRAPGLVAFEQAMLAANTARVASRLEALQDQVGLLEREIETLELKRVGVENQLESAQQQLANVSALASDGLVVSTRVTSLETNVIDLEGRLLDIDTSILRARQAIGTAERDGLELQSNRVADLTRERQEVDARLSELNLRISTQDALILETLTFGASPMAANNGQAPVFSYVIIREGSEIEADVGTPVNAGDVIVVRLVL